MKTGRNDPCPCGSGKKYKSCCLGREQQEASAAIPRLPGFGPGAWQAGFVTVPLPVTPEVSVLPSILLVVEGDRVLFGDVAPTPPAGPEEEAREIARAVREAERTAGYPPGRVLVRGPAVAAALARSGLEASAAEVLPGLDVAAEELPGAMAEMAALPPVVSPETWAGWGLPAAQVAELFRAAAAFYRAAPWEVFSDDEPMEAQLPGGRLWTACVLGGGGLECGLALYQDVDDYLGMLVADDPEDAIAGLGGRVLSLGFEARDALPPPMVREVRKAGWEVAGPAAYPHLTVLSLAGPGLAPEDLTDLVAVLRAVAGYAAYAASGADPEPGWVDESLVVLRRMQVSIPRVESLWVAPPVLWPACPEGPGADPAAALDASGSVDEFVAREEAVLGRFQEWLGRSGLSRTMTEKHALNAAAFVEFLVGGAGVPVRAVTEYDLRLFLYDWYPRKVQDGRTRALAVPTSLRRFFAFLAEEEGISCPWADPVLRDREAFETRYDEFPGGFWWDEEVQDWRAELYDDLEERVLIPEPLGGGEAGDTMGPAEAMLWGELQRRWLLWRDEVVRAGTGEPDAVRRELARRQREWERTPHPEHRGKSPLQVVRGRGPKKTKK
ncbi:MAG: SEC-C metal-binding domain-containing protein [Gemmatimonadota bacterium]